MTTHVWQPTLPANLLALGCENAIKLVLQSHQVSSQRAHTCIDLVRSFLHDHNLLEGIFIQTTNPSIGVFDARRWTITHEEHMMQQVPLRPQMEGFVAASRAFIISQRTNYPKSLTCWPSALVKNTRELVKTPMLCSALRIVAVVEGVVHSPKSRSVPPFSRA